LEDYLVNTICNELPNLRERFGDVTISGAERLLRIDTAKREIRLLAQEALDAVSARLNPKPRKNINVGEILSRAVDKRDAEAIALSRLLNTWNGKKIAVQFAVDLEAPAFVGFKESRAETTAVLAQSMKPFWADTLYAEILFDHAVVGSPSVWPELRERVRADLADDGGVPF
jgi:hypothetical protein